MDWHGCYDESWRGLIVDEAFAHPAKAARGLIRRIFEHMEAQGWLEPRSSVLDVFGGIGTTLIQGASMGHACVGVELEERFVELARENFELHRLAWEKFGDPMPVIIHGDSRKAAKLVRRHFGACVSSPPYSDRASNDAQRRMSGKEIGNGPNEGDGSTYGQSPGQLGAMKAGDVDAVISSPPYNKPFSQEHNGTKGGKRGQTPSMPGAFTTYGVTPGQIEGLPEGDFDACVGSPPYEEGLGHDSGHPRLDAKEDKRRSEEGSARRSGYGNGEMGSGETFWSAAREILLQVHQLLRPGGYSAWIVKDYVKEGKRVPFCDNWSKLCEACGFEIVQRARCWLVKETTNPGLFGEVTKKTERKSFFRRLHERKPGAVRIDWEEVIFARKVAA